MILTKYIKYNEYHIKEVLKYRYKTIQKLSGNISFFNHCDNCKNCQYFNNISGKKFILCKVNGKIILNSKDKIMCNDFIQEQK